MKELINKLIEERARLWEQMKDLNRRELEEDRTLTGEEREQWDRMEADMAGLDARIDELAAQYERTASVEALGEKYAKTATPPEADGEKVIRDFLTGKGGKTLDVPFTDIRRDVDPRTGEVRILSLTAAAGGNTVPTDFRRQLYEHLVANSAIRQTNATILTTAGGETIQIPKTASHGTAAIVGEGTTLAGTDSSFGQVSLGAWKYGQLITVSNELISDTGVDLLGYIARDAGRALGAVTGAGFITGTGTNEPLGLMVAAGTGVTGGTGQSFKPTATELINLQYSVAAPYANQGYWLMARATEGMVRSLADTTGQFLWQPGLQSGAPNMLLGRPVVSDPNVAAIGSATVPIGFGDCSPYFIRDVAGVRFERSDDYLFNLDQVAFRAILRTDGDLVDLTGCFKTFKAPAT